MILPINGWRRKRRQGHTSNPGYLNTLANITSQFVFHCTYYFVSNCSIPNSNSPVRQCPNIVKSTTVGMPMEAWLRWGGKEVKASKPPAERARSTVRTCYVTGRFREVFDCILQIPDAKEVVYECNTAWNKISNWHTRNLQKTRKNYVHSVRRRNDCTQWLPCSKFARSNG